MMTLFFLAMVHDRDTPLSDVLGLRRTHVVLCLIALALGVALQGPITLIVNAIYSRYPLAEQDAAVMRELLSPKTAHEKVALFAGVGVVGPVVEEVFFRGGILRNLRRTHTAGLTLLLHAAFNSASALVALYLGPEADALTRPQNFVASLVTLGLVALYGMVAARSARSAEARAEDQS
jgi:membrane protease YdiL (CAAX protease family)